VLSRVEHSKLGSLVFGDVAVDRHVIVHKSLGTHRGYLLRSQIAEISEAVGHKAIIAIEQEAELVESLVGLHQIITASAV